MGVELSLPKWSCQPHHNTPGLLPRPPVGKHSPLVISPLAQRRKQKENIFLWGYRGRKWALRLYLKIGWCHEHDSCVPLHIVMEALLDEVSKTGRHFVKRTFAGIWRLAFQPGRWPVRLWAAFKNTALLRLTKFVLGWKLNSLWGRIPTQTAINAPKSRLLITIVYRDFQDCPNLC